MRDWLAQLYLFGKHGTKVAKMQREMFCCPALKSLNVIKDIKFHVE